MQFEHHLKLGLANFYEEYNPEGVFILDKKDDLDATLHSLWQWLSYAFGFSVAKKLEWYELLKHHITSCYSVPNCKSFHIPFKVDISLNSLLYTIYLVIVTQNFGTRK